MIPDVKLSSKSARALRGSHGLPSSAPSAKANPTRSVAALRATGLCPGLSPPRDPASRRLPLSGVHVRRTLAAVLAIFKREQRLRDLPRLRARAHLRRSLRHPWRLLLRFPRH
jgi:hypothetical protein